MPFNLPGLAVSLVLLAGVAMAPVRAVQALTGRFTRKGTPPLAGLDAVRFGFLLAFVFWCALVRPTPPRWRTVARATPASV